MEIGKTRNCVETRRPKGGVFSQNFEFSQFLPHAARLDAVTYIYTNCISVCLRSRLACHMACWDKVYSLGAVVYLLLRFRVAGRPIGSLRCTTRQLDDALAKQRNMSCETKGMNNLCRQRFPQQRCHSYDTVKLGI